MNSSLLSPSSYMADESGFDWDLSSIEDNLEAQKLLAAAITSNTRLRGMTGEENEKRKLEELDDTPQSSLMKALHNDYSDSILHSEEDTKSQDGQEQKVAKKPGRKPLTNTPTNLSNSDPKQKRKAQNRAAQRAFRERKERYVKELEERIKELESSHNASSSQLQEENQQLKSLVQKLEAENYVLKGANFTFDFPIEKIQNMKFGNIDVTSNVDNLSTAVQDKEVARQDPWTPPSSNESDEQESEPASPNSAYESPFESPFESPEAQVYTDASTPQSDVQKPSPAMPTVFSFNDDVAKAVLSKTKSDFCEKLKEEVCSVPPTSSSSADLLLSQPVFDNTGALNTTSYSSIPGGITPTQERSGLFTEFRNPSLYNHPFVESTPIPPLFQDDLNNFGTIAPMLTPREEVKPESLGAFAPAPADTKPFHHEEDPEVAGKKHISCTKVWETISEHPRFEEFDLDELCSELRSKAKCSGHGPVVAEDELKEVMELLDRGGYSTRG